VSATERLHELDEAVAGARRREDLVLAARSGAGRAVGAAEAARASYHEAVGAGEPEDPAEEERLRLAVRGAREQAEQPLWAARLEGAERARVAAEQERDAFGREHFGEIAAEQAPLDGPVAERLADAWGELQAAEAEYAARVRVWTRLVQYGDLSIEDCPRLPTAGSADEQRSAFARGVEPPTPRPLRRALEEQVA